MSHLSEEDASGPDRQDQGPCSLASSTHSEVRDINFGNEDKNRSLIECLRKECRQKGRGPPEIYQLETVKENVKGDPMVRRWTFGERDDSKKNRTIVLVGETGTGKTTLINSLVNYFLGVKKEDNIWFEISDEKEGDPTTSKTTHLTVYEIFIEQLNISFSILDTPGFGDTDGLIGDEMIAKRLHTLLSSYDGIYCVDAIGIVVKSTETVLTDRKHYIYDSVQSLFGKNIKDNIVMFITHAEDMSHIRVFATTEKAKVPVPKNEQNQPHHFLYDNFQSDRRQAKQKETYNSKWDLGEKSTHELLDHLKGLKTQSLKITEKVLSDRMKLNENVQDIRKNIAENKDKLSQLEEAENDLHELEDSQVFRETVTESYKEKVDIPEGSWWTTYDATCCPVCEETCHDECWGISGVKGCKVMENGRCTKCTGLCPSQQHVKERKKYVWRTRDVLQNNKEYYKEHKAKSDMKKQKEDEVRVNEEALSTFLDEAYKNITDLKLNALKDGSAVTYVHVKFLTEIMKETGNTERVGELQQWLQMMEKDETTQKAVRYQDKQKALKS
ncbi:uncharacterized protein LOC134443085 [Engraulis encrasicolus]|uniref:uncharacterized protein LOC134443085 n=1 Tax=Engraulis encrasicolus TaxID=184585 RepID=UPI002FCFB403